jgi:hypothetical protein
LARYIAVSALRSSSVGEVLPMPVATPMLPPTTTSSDR